MTTSLTALDGTPLSAFCFGTMQFGGGADAAESQAMYEACRTAGINFFDTAHVYTEGRSEVLLGRFAGPERAHLAIATKAAYTGGASRANILKSCDESRTRLGMDVIDILYLHRWDAATPLDETFTALAELQQAGKIRSIGVSNYAAWQVMKAERAANAVGTSIAILQPMYSLVKRQAEVEILPMAQSEGFAVAPYSPLGGGLLTGKYARGGAGRLTTDTRYAARYGPDWMKRTAADLAALGAETGADPATLAVAWAARHPGVTAPIISARTPAQLQPSLDALGFAMDDALYQRIARLSPTPPPATDRLEE